MEKVIMSRAVQQMKSENFLHQMINSLLPSPTISLYTVLLDQARLFFSKGNYKEASDKYLNVLALEETGDVFVLHNAVLALLCAQRGAESLTVAQHLTSFSGRIPKRKQDMAAPMAACIYYRYV